MKTYKLLFLVGIGFAAISLFSLYSSLIATTHGSSGFGILAMRIGLCAALLEGISFILMATVPVGHRFFR